MATNDSPPAPPSRRRRFQFTLRTVFLVTTLWAVILGAATFVWDATRARETPRYHHTEYDAGTLCIFCYEGELLDMRTISVELSKVAQLGAVTGIKITSSPNDMYPIEDQGDGPARLTSGGWDYIRQLNLKFFSIDGVDDRDIPQLEKLSSLERLTVPASVTSTGLQRLRHSLPNCRISVK
jgi:hypothetical protein